MPLLDQAARTRIETAIHELEQRTAGEVVVVSVPRSDDYRDVRLLYAGAAALAAAAAVHWLLPLLGVGWLLWIELGVAVLVYAAFGWAPLLRAIVPAARFDQAVQRRAREEFLQDEVFATRDRSGVLILLSELEHEVVVLADTGIHARVNAAGWELYVRQIVSAIRSGRAADGVCEVISELGEVLALQFPPREDDRNELPNTVKQRDR